MKAVEDPDCDRCFEDIKATHLVQCANECWHTQCQSCAEYTERERKEIDKAREMIQKRSKLVDYYPGKIVDGRWVPDE